MARWQPHAAERLVTAALDLFEERGYEHTTVVDIAERAGLTRSTFFRHFQDKREVLFGDGTLAALLVEGIAAAPPGAGPLDAVAHALATAGDRAFPPERRAFGARRRAVIAANPELREREALKGLGLTASMAAALRERGVPELTSSVAAELGALAMTLAYERWGARPGAGEQGAAREEERKGGKERKEGKGEKGEEGEPANAGDFATAARRAMDEVRAAGAACWACRRRCPAGGPLIASAPHAPCRPARYADPPRKT